MSLALLDMTYCDDVVLDPSLCAGSTFIAAERLGAAAVVWDSIYVDVILLTGAL